MPSYTKFKGITEIGHSTLCDQLKSNLVEFHNWAMLEIGGFTNVYKPTSGPYGGDYSRLRRVEDPNYNAGQVWEAARQDWVWESGLEYAYQPIQISGVYVNSTFYPSSTSGAYAHSIDYPRGRVLFDTAIATGSTVQIEYSHRYCPFVTSDVPWFREVLFNSYRVDDPHFLQSGSGVYSILSQNRVQAPTVIVETVPRRRLIPHELGNGTHRVEQDVLYHIIAESTSDRDKMIDIVSYQKDKTILSFDKNAMAQQDKFPLDYNGSLRSGAMIYPDIVKTSGEGGFFWKKLYFKEMAIQEAHSVPPLFRAVVRGTIEVHYP